MIVTHIKLKNYKSFGDDIARNKIDSAKKMNLLYGENNSGKSNLLKFIDLIFKKKIKQEIVTVEGEEIKRREFTSFWNGIISNEPFIYNKLNYEKDIEFKITINLPNKILKKNISENSFRIINEEYLYRDRENGTVNISGKIKSLGNKTDSIIELDSVTLNSKSVFIKNNSTQKYFNSGNGNEELIGNEAEFSSFMSQFDDITLFLDNNRYLKTQARNSSEKLTSDNFKNWLFNLSVSPYNYEKFKGFIEFVKKHKPNDVSLSEFDPSFILTDDKINIMLDNRSERLPLDNFGTGIQQILYILSLVFETKSRILLIEELELNLSPKNQKYLFKVLRAIIESGKIDQVFFTSHSKYFAFRNDFSLYEISLDQREKVSKINRVNGVSKRFFNNRTED